ncbi:hypothetical protein BLNAU_4881 [Blattamonas nauphoetae]|uniref:Uncharacterized protein n=1 Tax=Blattamonas nauphoetae TaxID=2049346 RepID=A0ABQ9Y8A8_9EUKA|nr:hypothetical protein BLNAU_4881 [Blattamonas nauphoetae]
MGNQLFRLRTAPAHSFPDSRKSISTIDPEREPFLIFGLKTELSFVAKSSIYCSLIGLVQAEYPFDKAVQDRAVQFLKNLEPKQGDNDFAAKLVFHLVPSSGRSPCGFVESIVTLLSSPHSTVVESALSFLYLTLFNSSHDLRLLLVDSDLTTKVLATVQPHTLSIAGNETMLNYLTRIIDCFASLGSPSHSLSFSITTPVDEFNVHKMIFQKVVLPSSQFVTFLISNRFIINEGLISDEMDLLGTLIDISPFHRPTLEFVLASPIAMALPSCLSFIEGDDLLPWSILIKITNWFVIWKLHDGEFIQSKTLVARTLFSEGFGDTLEQKMIHEKSRSYGVRLVANCHTISQKLGTNVKRPQ